MFILKQLERIVYKISNTSCLSIGLGKNMLRGLSMNRISHRRLFIIAAHEGFLSFRLIDAFSLRA